MWLAAVRAERCGRDGYDLGVGPVRAGITAARLFEEHRPSWAVLVGSCGAYADGPPIGSAAVITGHRWADGATVAGLAYTPLPPELIPGPIDAPPCVAVTVPAITSDPGLASRLAALGHVEHLEAYAVAAAAAAAGVPLLVCLGVANRVGPDAHAEWLANRAAAEAAAVALAERTLASGSGVIKR